MELEVFRAFAKYAKKYYHGSQTPGIKKLRPNTYVTPHKRDAAIFGVPWDSRELKHNNRSGGRPPKKLVFKSPEKAPKDGPVYIYETINPTIRSEPTNTGARYDWNKAVTEETPVKLVKTIPSWKKALQ